MQFALLKIVDFTLFFQGFSSTQQQDQSRNYFFLVDYVLVADYVFFINRPTILLTFYSSIANIYLESSAHAAC